MSLYHRVATIKYQNQSFSFKFRDGSHAKHVQRAIRNRFQLPCSARLILVDSDGDDAVIDATLPNGNYILQVLEEEHASEPVTSLPATREKKVEVTEVHKPSSTPHSAPAKPPAPTTTTTPAPASEQPETKSAKSPATKWSVRRTLGDHDMGPALALLQDGRLATTVSAKSIRLWNLANEDSTPTTLTGHWNIVLDLAVLDNGHLLSAGGDWSLKVWDSKTNTVLRTINYEMTKKFKSKLISLKDGKFVSGSEDYKDNVEIWDSENGKVIQKLSGHDQMITSLTNFSDDRIVSASSDRTIKVWDPKSGNCIKTLEVDASIYVIRTFHDGRLISNEDNNIQIWDSALTKKTKLVSHTKDVRAIAILNENQFASGGDDQTILIWDTNKSSPIQTLKSHISRVNTLLALNNVGNNTLASGSFDRTVKIWV